MQPKLGRAQFVQLVGIELEQYNSMFRREQVPLVPPRELSEKEVDARGYSPSAALILALALEFSERFDVSREAAAVLALNGMKAFGTRWRDICTTSELIAAKKEPDADILLAVVDWPGLERERASKKPPHQAFIGTLAELAAMHPGASNIIAVSITRCAALMRQRAAKARIDISEFWGT